jgi:hypothetical protein
MRYILVLAVALSVLVHALALFGIDFGMFGEPPETQPLQAELRRSPPPTPPPPVRPATPPPAAKPPPAPTPPPTSVQPPVEAPASAP